MAAELKNESDISAAASMTRYPPLGIPCARVATIQDLGELVAALTRTGAVEAL